MKAPTTSTASSTATPMNPAISMPTKAPLLSGSGWTAWLAALIVLCGLVPLLNLVIPADSALHLSDFAVGLVAKIMCYAICALAMDLIWGYTGILSLGQACSSRWAAMPWACT